MYVESEKFSFKISTEEEILAEYLEELNGRASEIDILT